MILVLYICYLLATKAGITRSLQRKDKTLKSCVWITKHESQAEADVEADGTLLAQVIDPRLYESVLPATEEHIATKPMESKELYNEDPRRLIFEYTYGSIS